MCHPSCKLMLLWKPVIDNIWKSKDDIRGIWSQTAGMDTVYCLVIIKNWLPGIITIMALQNYQTNLWKIIAQHKFLASCNLAKYLPWVYVVLLSFVCLFFSVRFCLGSMSLFAFSKFRSSISYRFGSDVALFLTMITATQFHLLFYFTRPLPNTMALVLG